MRMWNCVESKRIFNAERNWSSEEIWVQTDDEFNYVVENCAGVITLVNSQATIFVLYHNLIINTCHLINVISKLESTINVFVYVSNNKLWIGIEWCCVVGIFINFDLSIECKNVPVFAIIMLI